MKGMKSFAHFRFYNLIWFQIYFAAPPPIPSNRPRGRYVPPPLPTSRPKAAYVHPVSTPSSGSSTPQARSNVTTPDSTLNDHVNSTHHGALPERPAMSQKPTIASRPHQGVNGGTAPVAFPRPSQRTSVANTNYHPPVAGNKPQIPGKPSVAAKPASPPKQSFAMNDILSMFGSTSSSSSSSKAHQNKSSSSSSSDLGWQIASGIANNITAKDVQRASGAVSAAASSETGRKFGNAAVSSASSSSDPKLQFVGYAAKNVNAKDVSRAADTAGKVAASEQGQRAASSAWGFAQNNKDTINAAFSSNTTQNGTAISKSASNNNIDLLTGLFSSAAQPAASNTNQFSKSNSLDNLLGFGFDPVPASNSKPKPVGLLPPPGPSASRAKPRPTIIRPGASKAGSKPNSRSASPKMELEGLDLFGGTSTKGKKSKGPPPRVSLANLVKQSGILFGVRYFIPTAFDVQVFFYCDLIKVVKMETIILHSNIVVIFKQI